ncbi:hypothetical protein JCM19240_1958 [Vibrio maritimus]|uniref:Uncharacterized protein n=1 Tax=Vibrio maritimus TaxID=990268 RepID=A0A090TQ22_9VIBR|nr:hypothetical protein JCM19240_1958 [Vibrio maritimus]
MVSLLPLLIIFIPLSELLSDLIMTNLLTTRYEFECASFLPFATVYL